MMEWGEYISNLLSSEEDGMDLAISLNDGQVSTGIPPIIRASIFMLEKIDEHQGNRNVLVFPEKEQTGPIFSLMYLFHNLSRGKIRANYDPDEFTPGEKLKVGNAVVEYLGKEKTNDEGEECLVIGLANNLKIIAPIRYLPIFQKTSTNRRLSTLQKYGKERDAALASLKDTGAGNQTLNYVSQMKTHMISSIYVMTSVSGAKEQLINCKIDGKSVLDVFFIGQVNAEGDVSNVSSGQMTGVPTIVLASSLYAIRAAVDSKNPIQSIIIEGTKPDILSDQLDALDDLLKLKIPIIYITDIVNSFELGQLSIRKFNIWRWDKDSLTKQLYDVVPLSSDRKIKNCANHAITYIHAEGSEISLAMEILSAHRKEISDQSPQMMRLFNKLFQLTFVALRATMPFSDVIREQALKSLQNCGEILKTERHYLNDSLIREYESVLKNLEAVYSKGYVLGKEESLKKFLLKQCPGKVYLIISDEDHRAPVQEFWDSWCIENQGKAVVTVLTPTEYYSMQIENTEWTIVCGWLKKAIMRKILYSYNTSQYAVLLYTCENRWGKYNTRKWQKALDNSENQTIIEKSFSSSKVPVSIEGYKDRPHNMDMGESSDLTDELNEIELILNQNRFKPFDKRKSSDNDVVEAIPVCFVGGYISFYRIGHKVISATKIITENAGQIEIKLSTELHVGDFIVVREADKDLIRELADVILLNSGKSEMRELSSKWREALQIETLFHTTEEIFKELQAAGCDKGFATVKRWIEDEDVIAPQSKSDLKIIAEVTENELLRERLDEIFEAAREVRSAHQLAGRKLSEQLRYKLALELKKFERIDPFNFWDAIDIEIENIGNVKVLKITDIESIMEVDAADTNRLIEA